MKKFGIFLLGTIVGIFLTFFVGVILNNMDEIDNPYNVSGLSMLSEKGNCIATGDIRIFQTLANGIALAHSDKDSGAALLLGKGVFLLLDKNGKLFYDDEKIKIPAKKCAKQIGVYTYETKAELQKTVPAVIIE